ncbi:MULTISPECIES: cutinase family protein [unclassified Rhodococcus (in: high G+C Gram-positive bacteria)]|uniref:cutinase family protein n=1 Tax=unclassified Rhodococcus (in: high G+C Gram-positive bacteria) TaxID=192944 RepID=UPI00163A5DBB|nr:MULTISPECIES: cutinase family protein [unclassified Rhodococcus (in: high G+C Gram-positive bacteria)]MBC2637977.1 cutinase family protein [Rhodococcus sp. 3A]MBC2897276.1 cutinase family protein [Rhodococcus sp. 4CII]
MERRGSARKVAHRRRIAGSLVAPGALGLVALLATPWSNPGSPATTATALTAAASNACYDMISIAVAGRGDTPREGTHQMLVAPDGTPLPASYSSNYTSPWIDEVVNAPQQAVGGGSYAAVYVEYPANMNSYEDAVNAGVDNTETVMRSIHASCPDTKFSIVGYSEGADVARRVAMEVGNQESADGSYEILDPASVVGVVILADAGRDLASGPFPGAENEFRNPDGFDLAYQSGQSGTSGQGALPGTSGSFGALDGKVASFCSEGDLTCSAPENIALLQLAINVGRQLNVDSLQKDGLTPATGQDLVVVLGQVALAAFADIQAQGDWMQSDETFLDVLVKVSDPAYKPGTVTTAASAQTGPISSNKAVDLVYLPTKVRNEIIGFIEDNENTIQVAMSDPYQQTLGEGTGHHFDYWRDANAGDGKPLTSAQYAAAWLTHLAQEAEKGKQSAAVAEPSTAKLAAASTKSAEVTSVAPTTDSAKKPQLASSAGSTTQTTSGSVTPTTTPTTVATTSSPASVPASSAAAQVVAETTAPVSEPQTAVEYEPEPTTTITTAVEPTQTEVSRSATTTPVVTTTRQPAVG